MTTLTGRSATALLIVDVQTGVVANTDDRDAVIANIGDLLTRARAAGAPVVFVQQTDEHLVRGGEAWQIVPGLAREPADTTIEKHHPDSFEGTSLESVLADRGVGHVVVVGAQSDACVRATIHGAFTRGYDTTLVADAHTSDDLSSYGAPPPAQVRAHTNLYWRYMSAPGRVAAVTETKDVDFTGA